jgi:hypothetical protein
VYNELVLISMTTLRSPLYNALALPEDAAGPYEAAVAYEIGQSEHGTTYQTVSIDKHVFLDEALRTQTLNPVSLASR